MIDERIYPGLTNRPDPIVVKAMKYCGVTDLNDRSGDKAACKRLIIVLMKNTTSLRHQQIADRIGLQNHTIVTYVTRNYGNDYYGGNQFYTYTYENMKEMLNGNVFYTVQDLFAEAIEKFPIQPEEKLEGLAFLTSPPWPQKIRNRAVQGFVVYLQKMGLTSAEIANFLNLNRATKPLDIKLKREDLYKEAISKTIKEKMVSIELNKINNEKRNPTDQQDQND